MEDKRVSDSFTTSVYLLRPENLNGYGRLFGGELVRWIDMIAGVAARRHCGHEITTACIDNIVFEAPAFVNDTMVLEACVTYVGKTSMEVRVDTYVEHLDGTRTRANRAYSVMVALDENQKPTPVPGLILETQEQKDEWKAAEMRKKIRANRKQHEI